MGNGAFNHIKSVIAVKLWSFTAYFHFVNISSRSNIDLAMRRINASTMTITTTMPRITRMSMSRNPDIWPMNSPMMGMINITLTC